MAWRTTTFQRESLYNEVWTEPIVKVAGRYGLSDVGLRKICISLDIPVPPRGYWARLAAGRAVKQSPLGKSDGNPTYTRSIHVEEKNPQLEQRIRETRAAAVALPGLSALAYVPSDDLSKLGREAAQIEKASRRLKDLNGTLQLMDRAWADLEVSPGARTRALQLLDHFAAAFKAMNGTFDLTPDPATVEVLPPHQRKRTEIRRGHLLIHGKQFFVRLKERVKSEEISAPLDQTPIKPARKPATTPKFSAMSARNKYLHTPTGRMQFFVFSLSTYYDVSKIEDTSLTRVEDKLPAFVERLEALALKQKLAEDLAKEAALERQRQSEIWQKRKAIKDALLKRLEQFENQARDLDRAESLRRLAKKISAGPTMPNDLVKSLDLLETMANWLDPLVSQHWPEVDDTPDRNPHSYW